MYFMLELNWPIGVHDEEQDYFELKLAENYDADLRWKFGARFDNPQREPIDMRLVEVEGSLFPPVFLHPIPLMTAELRAVLEAAGVSNIDYYPVRIAGIERHASAPVYFAYNLIDAIAAADLSRSAYKPSFGETLVAVDFDSLALDESKARGALMFRLAESLNGVVVHESVKLAIEAAGIDHLGFVEPKDWIG